MNHEVIRALIQRVSKGEEFPRITLIEIIVEACFADEMFFYLLDCITVFILVPRSKDSGCPALHRSDLHDGDFDRFVREGLSLGKELEVLVNNPSNLLLLRLKARKGFAKNDSTIAGMWYTGARRAGLMV